jgi:hypothetical protein
MGTFVFFRGSLGPERLCGAPRESKEATASIPAVRVAGAPEGSQGLSRVHQSACDIDAL